MQENNTENDNISRDVAKKNHKNNKNEKKKSNFFKETKSEFKKITWPNKKVLTKQTITVIFISIIVGAIIYGYDFLINFAIEKVVNL